MKRPLVAGLALAIALAIVPATGAGAQTPSSSKVYVTHGLPLDNAGTKVDVFVGAAGSAPNPDGSIAAGNLINDFLFGQTAGPLDLPAANYTVYLAKPTANDDGKLTPDEVIYAQDLAVPAGKNLSAVASLTAGGAPTVAVFVNDVSKVRPWEGRLSVRHAAAAPAVNVEAGIFPWARLFPFLKATIGPAANGQQGDTTLWAGRYDIDVKVASSGAKVLGAEKFAVDARTLTNVYAVGVPGQSLQFVVQKIRL